MYIDSQTNNIKLKGLDNQMGELDQDFKNMIKAREEARRKLEERFKDVYTRIKNNKDYMIETGKEFNEKLKVYQNDYSNEIENTRDKLKSELDCEKELIEGILKRTDERMKHLEDNIELEKQERIEDWNKQLSDIDRRYIAIKQGFSSETKNRISKKKNVLNAMAEGNAKIMEWLDEERSERQKQRDTLKNDIETAVKGIDARFLKFQKETRFEFDSHREGHENSLLEEWGKKIDMLDEKLKGISQTAAFGQTRQ